VSRQKVRFEKNPIAGSDKGCHSPEGLQKAPDGFLERRQFVLGTPLNRDTRIK